MGAFSFGCWLIASAGVVGGIVALSSQEDRSDAMTMWIFADIHPRAVRTDHRRMESSGWAGRPAGCPGDDARHAGVAASDARGVFRRAADGGPDRGRADDGGAVVRGADRGGRVRGSDGSAERGGVVRRGAGRVALALDDAGPVFGLPHDVHPVLLGVRMDLALEAGISQEEVRGIETWEDLRRVLGPLMADADGDGQPDRYLLSFWPTESHRDKIEMLLLQSGTGFFDEDGMPVIASDANARTLARMVSWCVGPGRIAADVRDFDATGNQLKTDGYAVTYFMPDWMCAVWKNELPNMAGKLELIPLPAAEPGGRRTSVWGGTMLGIPKTAEDFEAAWAFAKPVLLARSRA
jgi:hypothetical protein